MYIYALLLHILVNPSEEDAGRYMLRTQLLIALSSLTLAGTALAADNAALVNKPVWVQVSGVAGGALSGKLIAVEGCLYVQFDQKTKEGYTSVRLDQVSSLQILAAGSNPSLEAVLRLEPKKCFEEANG
jgi:hypothetical protein